MGMHEREENVDVNLDYIKANYYKTGFRVIGSTCMGLLCQRGISICT